jgi:hypothetical protein
VLITQALPAAAAAAHPSLPCAHHPPHPIHRATTLYAHGFTADTSFVAPLSPLLQCCDSKQVRRCCAEYDNSPSSFGDSSRHISR